MSSFVNNFRQFRNFPKYLKQNIKLFHVFSYDFAYCVTNDDKVYGFGDNICKYLGYNESNDYKSYVLIQELCDKNIEEFFGYSDVYFARSQTNVIYSWGWNELGQLSRSITNELYLQPVVSRT